jgi:hypothetical protein
MNPVNFSSGIQETYTPAPSQKSGPQAGSLSGSTQSSGGSADSLHLSPTAMGEAALTGRVAADAQSGSLTSDQAQQLYSQISTIHTQIVADRQADGGTLSPTDAQAIQQSQSQLSQTVYGDAHDGATAPTNPTRAGQREAQEAGRIIANQKAGNLTTAQGQQLSSQLSTIQQQITADEQANGGTLSQTDAKAINQLQNQFSGQIYEAAHGTAPSQPAGTA